MDDAQWEWPRVQTVRVTGWVHRNFSHISLSTSLQTNSAESCLVTTAHLAREFFSCKSFSATPTSTFLFLIIVLKIIKYVVTFPYMEFIQKHLIMCPYNPHTDSFKQKTTKCTDAKSETVQESKIIF